MTDTLSRRSLFAGCASCAAHLFATFEGAPAATRARFGAAQRGTVVADRPFGRLERLADGVWALVSTPLEERTTLCNGGIIAGRQGVVVIEGFASVEGAQWMAARALQLTGMRPSHVVLTHFHGDHSSGLAGYRSDQELPLVLHTETTRGLLQASLQGEPDDSAESPLTTLTDAGLIDESGEPVRVDLGGRAVRITSRGGHTPSDLSVLVEDPRVVFCGDLVWNEMFPNYRDAIPTRLWSACNDLAAHGEATYVPGHGPLAGRDDLRRYLDLIEHVGNAARRAFEQGRPAVEAAADYQVPAGLGEWFMFSPRYYEVAFTAWHRELTG
jgi:glyoxylase-like metal-dependent hydrolase (beta-lactamase superfamily II)